MAGSAVALPFFNQRSHLGFFGWAGVVLLSNLPDVDFLFGFVQGAPNRYHHLGTHSIVFGVAVGMVFGFGYWIVTRRGGFRWGILAFGVVFSHILLDFFTLDQRPPYGIPLLWPVRHEFFLSPVLIFQDVSKASTSDAFLRSLFCWHNVGTVLREIAILGPVWVGVAVWKRRSRIAGVRT